MPHTPNAKGAPRIAPSEADRIYAAGFFDGEGSIGIYAHTGKSARATYVLWVVAGQAVPAPIFWLQERWGGYVRAAMRKSEVRADRAGIRSDRPSFHWSIASRRAMAFLIDVRPWLQVKGEQADVAIAFQRTRRWGGLGRGPQVEQLRLEHAAIGAAAKLQIVRLREDAYTKAEEAVR